jgi:predicted transcriptional regulator
MNQTPPPKDIDKRRRILEWMTGEHQALDIARGVGACKTSAYQMLRYMEKEGLVAREKRGHHTYWTATGKEINEQEIAETPYRRREPCLLAQMWR